MTQARPTLGDERGMTLALTIMLVVVIGVMGAGLLTLVQSDLQATAGYTGGQRALELAETGVEAARRELLVAPLPESYDGDATPSESAWSAAAPPAACGWLPPLPGRCLADGGGVARTSIRYLPAPTALSGTGSVTDPAYAPEVPPDDGPGRTREYYLIESDGVFGDHRRRVQAIVFVEWAESTNAEGTTGAVGIRTWSWRECRESACI